MLNDLKKETTIAILAYNEGKHIKDAILSAVSQTDNLIIYDNASEDDTQKICLELTKQYSNIKYIRHDNNIGGSQNFEKALMQCNTKYFMWMDGHDVLPEYFVNTLYNQLQQQPDAALAYTAVEHINEDNETLYYYDYWFHNQLSSGDPFVRSFAVIKFLRNCQLVKCLFKTKSLKNSWDKNIIYKCINWDNIILCYLASKERFIYNSQIKYKRRMFNKKSDYGYGPHNYKIVIEEQLKIISKIPTINVFKKFYYYQLSKKALSQRFNNARMLNKKEDIVFFLSENNFQKKLNKLTKKYTGKKVMVYGAGIAFEAIKENYDLSKLNIIGIADKKFEEGQEFMGYKTFKPDTFMKENPDLVLVAMIDNVIAEDFFMKKLYSEFGKFKYETLI